jgi:hypothetical protein
VNDFHWALSMVAVFVVTWLVAVFMGRWTGIQETRQEAIKAGCGEWCVNPKTGRRFFSWKS